MKGKVPTKKKMTVWNSTFSIFEHGFSTTRQD